MTYILVDTANTFFRARHVVRGDADIKLGMALHITFNSIKKINCSGKRLMRLKSLLKLRLTAQSYNISN